MSPLRWAQISSLVDMMQAFKFTIRGNLSLDSCTGWMIHPLAISRKRLTLREICFFVARDIFFHQSLKKCLRWRFFAAHLQS